jgi:hypothetical protein
VAALLCLVLWRTPYPITEAVALFEDVANRPPSQFLIPETSYYRPLFHLTLSVLWNSGASLDATLAWIKLVQIVPVLLLVGAFIWYVRPRTPVDAAAAVLAVAVLLGSRGFRDNLELPLSYTTVGMPLALLVWILLNREPRAWQAPAIVVLTFIAIGFKEQGLVLVPLVVMAWWTRAPGAGRGVAAMLAAVAVAYIVLRLAWRESLPMFEQAVGLGFSEMEPPEATARFGAFPYWVYAYSGASTIANVLFSEPTRGMLRITQSIQLGQAQTWQVVHLGSSIALTGLIAWWGARSLRRAARDGWTLESRTLVALVVVLLGCGVLSFNYSRDRLGGMAVPFYALAAFFAARAAAGRALEAPRPRMLAAGLALTLLMAAWQTRAMGTIEFVRATSLRNHMEWLTLLPARRVEFADRATYLRIMHSMVDQGTAPAPPRPTRYPPWIAGAIGPVPPPVPAMAYSLADAIQAGDVLQAYGFIRAGQDPNEPIAVRDPALTGGRAVLVPPLVWAVASNSEHAVQMLLGFGASMDRPTHRRAICLAQELGYRVVAEELNLYGDASSAACPDRRNGDTPLLVSFSEMD